MIQYGIRYCAGVQKNVARNKTIWDFSGASNTEELRIVLEETLMLRRLKQNVLDQLPEKTRSIVILDKNSVKTELKTLKLAADEFQRAAGKGGSDVKAAVMKWYTESAFAKVDAVTAYVLDVLETGRKVLIFAHHLVMMDALSEALTKKHYDFVRIDGATQSDTRKRNCDLFQTDENVKAAVLSITAANVGITLTAASLVVFAELYWNPGVLVQAEDRAHRVGQVDNVQVHYLVAKDTVDDHIWPMINRKLGILSRVGLGNAKDDFKAMPTTQIESPDKKTGVIAAGEHRKRTLDDYFEQMAEDDDEIFKRAKLNE